MQNYNSKFKINFSLLIFNLTEPERSQKASEGEGTCLINLFKFLKLEI